MTRHTMTRHLAGALAAGALALGFAGTVQATLIDRGGGLIYDTTLDITWLQNANLAATDTFGVNGIYANGTMTWDTANAWIWAMNAADYLGFSDWRLPTMVDIGNDGCKFVGYSGTDCGFNVARAAGSPNQSEMASLYYDTLGNLGYCDTSGNCPQTGWGLTHTGADGVDFSNLQPYDYWSGLEYAPSTTNAWYFNFSNGIQDAAGKGFAFYAWAVLPGDVGAPVPEPPTVVLMALALAGLLGVSRRARRR